MPSSQITIRFDKLRFFAFHGLYEIEKNAGNEFEFNLSVTFNQGKEIITHLDETINYVAIYNIVKKEMQQPRELLETFLTELAASLKQYFPEIISLQMSLFKLTVPIENLEGRIGVALDKIFE